MSDDDDGDVVITIRVPQSLHDRIQALIPEISEKREFALKEEISRSDAVRYLLLRGIEELEEEEEGSD